MNSRRQVTLNASLLAVVCLAGAVWSVTRLDRLRPTQLSQDSLYISSPRVLKRLWLGYTGLAADVYWTRTVQYFGSKHHERAARYDLLLPMLQLTTGLDPKLVVAYEFGSIFLAQQPPEGAGMPDRAVEFAEQGIRNNPDEWKLYLHLGFIHFMERKDYPAAADAFYRGSQRPGAHPFLRVLAAAMSQYSGDRRTARFLWTKIYETSEDEMIRANALRRLRALDVDEAVLQLQAVVEDFRVRNGRYPSSWNEVAAAGMLRGIPIDPTGRAFRLTPDGHVEIQVPEDIPFITEGLPGGKKPEFFARPEAMKK